MAEVGTFYQSKYTGEQLDEILKNVYDAVPLDGSKPMTGALDIKKVENGYSRFNKNHTQTTDLGTELKDISKGGSVVALLLKAADQAARLQFGTSVYDLIHTGNITGYVKPYADAAQAASEAAESALEGVREAIEAIPEGAATPIVNDLTTGGTSMALSAEMGKVLKGELDTKVNPNLLDNWYFGNPVNQRGQTEYKVTGYTIDRWRTTNDTYTVSVGNGVVTVTADTAANRYVRQCIERPELLRGKTVTVSMLSGNDELVSATGIVPATAATEQLSVAFVQIGDGGVYFQDDGSGGLFVQLRATKAKTYSYKAVKLELGTQQTLAHKDASGKWVLNEIPDYSEQLLRCCMSTADSSDTYANNKVTPAAINAVNNAGDTMTGGLILQSSKPYTEAGWTTSAFAMKDSNSQRTGWLGVLTKDTGEVQLRVANDVGSIMLYPSNGVVQIASNGEQTVLHTGNKPSGSYTGNGSATSRTIDTGGIGHALMIYSANGSALVLPSGAFIIAEGVVTGIVWSGAHFQNGILTLGTTNAVLNATGGNCVYQVL